MEHPDDLQTSDLVFYDRSGNPVAYSEDGDHLYLYNGTPAAYFDSSRVYSFSGRPLGFFEDGWIFANDGTRALFTDAASEGPTMPVRRVQPVKSVKRVLPVKYIRRVPPVRPTTSLRWSELSGEQFFG